MPLRARPWWPPPITRRPRCAEGWACGWRPSALRTWIFTTTLAKTRSIAWKSCSARLPRRTRASAGVDAGVPTGSRGQARADFVGASGSGRSTLAGAPGGGPRMPPVAVAGSSLKVMRSFLRRLTSLSRGHERIAAAVTSRRESPGRDAVQYQGVRGWRWPDRCSASWRWGNASRGVGLDLDAPDFGVRFDERRQLLHREQGFARELGGAVGERDRASPVRAACRRCARSICWARASEGSAGRAPGAARRRTGSRSSGSPEPGL